MAVKNTCTPDDIYGPMQHTMFLGCSIMSFSCSLGLNEQCSTLTVTLVKDTCEGSKVYYDSSLNSGTWTAADPGFLGLTNDIIGLPAYFRVQDFEYCGIIQSWEEENSESSYPTYRVQISDPRLILEGAQCILNDYGGYVGDATIFGAYGPYNVFNVYGFMESTSPYSCHPYSLDLSTGYVPYNLPPDGPTFGADAGGFGGARVNNNGISFGTIYTGINVLCNQIPRYANRFSPYGRIAFRGTPSNVGHGIMPYDIADVYTFDDGHTGKLSLYYVDISELPVPPDTWRINDTTMSIMDIISMLCEDMGYDYYIELIPVRNEGTIEKFIKVRVLNRNVSPVYGKIQEYVDNHDDVISKTTGKELRNEPTSAVIIGGNKQTLYQIYQDYDPENDGNPGNPVADDIILPYFGLHPDGSTIVPEWNSTSGWNIYVNTSYVNNQLRHFTFPAEYIYIEELELRAALEGMNEWMTVCTALGTDCGSIFDSNIFGKWDYKYIITMIDSMSQGAMAARDFINTNRSAIINNSTTNEEYAQAEEDINIIYNWVNGFAQHYGKDYQVRVPFTCGRIDELNNQILYSDEPTDGGWTEQPTVLLANNNDVITDYFRLPDNRIGNFARFNYADYLDLKGLKDSKYLIWEKGGIKYLFVEITADSQYVFHSLAPAPQYPRIVVSLPSTIRLKQTFLDESQVNLESYGLILALIDRAMSDDPAKKNEVINKAKKAMTGVGGRYLMMPLGFPLEMPAGVAVGIKSNVLSYGPWIQRGPSGKVRVERDEGLVPWEYGGMDVLNAAGTAKATDSITQMQVCERGSLSMPGFPRIPLGAELLAVDGGYNQYLIQYREVTPATYAGFNCGIVNMGYLWVGDYGPSVTDIQVNWGQGGVTSEYSFRTFSPKFGRWEKFNADRVKRAGSDRIKFNKALRMRWLTGTAKKQFELNNRHAIGGGKTETKQVGNTADRVGKGAGYSNHMTQTPPGELIVGHKQPRGTADDPGKRDIIGLESIPSIDTYFKNLVTPSGSGVDFADLAIMSWDGLLRPISLGGDGGLPRFARGANDSLEEPYPTTPPLLTKTGLLPSTLELMNETNVPIYQYTLNPFANPGGYSWSQLTGYCDNFVGHDIDILGRGNGYDNGVGTTGLPMPWSKPGVGVASGQADYANDYRAFALRGPLVIQGWGYTTEGYPIPNKDDNEIWAASGIFVDGTGNTKFLDGWLQKSHTWPVGPVDLRWDNKRKVWTAGPPPLYELRTHTVTGDIVRGEDYWAITDSGVDGGVYYEYGFNINPQLYDIPSGTTVLAQYDGTSSYKVIDSNRYPQRFALATLSGTLSAGGTTNAEIKVGDLDQIGLFVEVNDWFLNAGETLLPDTKVAITPFYDENRSVTGWYVIQAQCANYTL